MNDNKVLFTDETWSDRLKKWAEEYGDKTAIEDEKRSVTYSQLDINSGLMADALCSEGIKVGDHVIVQMNNSVEAVELLFAIYKTGAYPVMALPAQRANDLEGIFEKVKPVAYFLSGNYMGKDNSDLAKYFKEKTPSVHLIYSDEGNDWSKSLDSLKKKGENEDFCRKSNGESIAHILLSGGTTGIPKLIARTHADYIYNARCCAKRCDVTSSEIYLCALPFSHNFSMVSFGIFGTLESGGRVVMCEIPDVYEMLELIQEKEITATAMVPALLSVFMDALEWDDEYDISSLRLVLVGGSVFEESEARRAFNILPCAIQQVFGTAEGLNCITSLQDELEVIVNTQGKPVSEKDEIKIVDDNIREVANGEYGELVTKGPYTIKEYYMAEEDINKSSFTYDGYYRTGDKARITADGNLIIAGRIKEQINKGGEKIMPSEVEKNLLRHEMIKQAAVIGMPDDNLGTCICAYVISEDKNITLHDIRAFLKDLGVAQYKWPDKFVVLDNFPLTKVGKVDKKALKEIGAR